MAKSMEAQLTALENSVNAENRKLQKQVKHTLIFYGVVLLIVLGYTTWAMQQIRTLTSKEAIHEYASSQINQLPELRHALLAEYDKNSEVWAKDLVGRLQECLPALENEAQTFITEGTETLIAELEAEVLVGFAEYIQGHSAELKAQFAELTDEEAHLGMVYLFVDLIGAEMDKFINDRFVLEMHRLTEQIRELKRSGQQLSKHDEAKRRVLYYWSYMAHNGAEGGSVFADLINRFKSEILEYVSIAEHLFSVTDE